MGGPPAMKRALTAWPALLVAALWVLPLIFLAGEAAGGSRGMWWWVEQRGWRIAAGHTLEQASLVAALAFLPGWLAGVLTGLAPCAWRRLIQGLCALPLLLPPFLWAIGWSFLHSRAPRTWYALFDGRWGLLCAGLAVAVPLTVLAASVAVSRVPRAQWEFALTKFGKWRAMRLSARRAWPAAAGAAVLAGLLCAADAGAGQIMGRHGMAGEVLVSLALRQDAAEAAAKALASAVLLLPLALVAAWTLTKSWSHRQTARSGSRSGTVPAAMRLDWLLALALFLAALMALALPASGLAAPLQRPRAAHYMAEAMLLWKSSFAPTLWYSLGSGLIATAGGAVLAAYGAGRTWFMAVCLLAVALPSSLRALGWVAAGVQVPAVRSLLSREPGVAFALGLQWLPLAALLLAPAFAALPASWNDRRRLTGMSRPRFARCVLAPVLAPWLAMAAFCCALLSLADVTSLMLLQPPGATAFTSHVFAVMDNSPEIIVASLCAALLLVPLALGLALLAASAFIRRTAVSFAP